MALIKGMTVYLTQRTQTGVDPFNRPTYSEREVAVENVLVSPVLSDDVRDSTDIHGRTAEYILGIPKGDTHEWENVKVRFFGETWQTFGPVIQGIEENIPLDWHKKVQVVRYE